MGALAHSRYLTVFLVPLILGLVLAVRPMLRVCSRVDDGYRGKRIIKGNGFELMCAPAGAKHVGLSSRGFRCVHS